MDARSTELRLLGARDVPAALRLLATDPVVNVFVDHRTRLTQLEPRWLGGEAWGWFEGSELSALCHVAANLVPANASEAACAAFARRVRHDKRSSTIVGPQQQVRWLWSGLVDSWPAPRDERWQQPHLEIDRISTAEPDPAVRRTRADQLDTLYPACVAMYTDEVGVSPELDGGRQLYRARVAQLIDRGWSFSRIERGRVLFKAEVASVSPFACQIQGVYVDPAVRRRGLATAGMAAVVNICLRDIAPVVSLYVNEHNEPARASYARVGFRQSATFATLMF